MGNRRDRCRPTDRRRASAEKKIFSADRGGNKRTVAAQSLTPWANPGPTVCGVAFTVEPSHAAQSSF